VVTPYMMCTEFVQEINALLESGSADKLNATRFSYVVSMVTDTEANQVMAFEDCVESEATAYPKETCIGLITQSGRFDLYSDAMKAETCQLAINELNDLQTANGVENTNSCAVLTSMVYQSYDWFL
jgi:hypothetical protein